MRIILTFSLILSILSNVNSQNLTNKVDNDSILLNRLINLKKSNEIFKLDLYSLSKEFTEIEYGKVFLIGGDSLTGKLEILSIPSIPMPVKIKFYDEKDINSIKKIRADKIIGFRKGDKSYFSKKTKDLPPFYIERILKGKVNLYTFRYVESYGQNNFGVQSSSYKIDYYIEGEDNVLIRLDCNNIIDFITEKFSNKPEFLELLTKEKSGLIKFVKTDKYEFNTCDYILELVQMYNEIN